ncbi:MAG: hypothetical protein HY073_03190 [Deltaproteobacteria bacterium]|nr:hypothetical protein [Deltaproteobacteria bacterium]
MEWILGISKRTIKKIQYRGYQWEFFAITQLDRELDRYYEKDDNPLMSDFLFSRPSLFSGLARVLDLFAIFDSYNVSSSGTEADMKALLQDWKAVGKDLQNAIQMEVRNYDQRSAQTSGTSSN